MPPDLASAWLVASRPRGEHCLLLAARGATAAARADGQRLARFPSQLPAGSGATAEGPESFTLLDAVVDADAGRLYLCDVLVWRGYDLQACAADFRLFWLQTKARACSRVIERAKVG